MDNCHHCHHSLASYSIDVFHRFPKSLVNGFRKGTFLLWLLHKKTKHEFYDFPGCSHLACSFLLGGALPLDGSITAFTSATALMGKWPFFACSRTMSSLSAM